MTRITRRNLVACGGALALVGRQGRAASGGFRLGLTPVFLDNDAEVVGRLRNALSEALGTTIELEQRRTYAEVTSMLLEGAVDAAWLCGYPFLQHRDALDLMAVPVWNGRPLYQSYLIVGAADPAEELADLEGGTHAFSDPDSNSGFLVTASDLARMGQRPESFFRRSIFTYGHRNVVRAVADGLVRSGSVDGYVWEALSQEEPQLTAQTRVIARSEWIGFPPFCIQAARRQDPEVQRLKQAALLLDRTDTGRAALASLHLDKLIEADASLFDGIAARMRDVVPDR